MLSGSLRWFVSCAMIVGLSLFIVTADVQGEKIAKVVEEDRASDFTLRDLDGRTVRLSDYKGKVVLLYFMASWCRECPTIIPHLREIYSLYSKRGLVLLNIDVQESEKKAAAFSKKYQIPYQTLVDEDGKVSRSYGIFGIPVKVLIDRDGRIICWNCRSLDQLLENKLK